MKNFYLASYIFLAIFPSLIVAADYSKSDMSLMDYETLWNLNPEDLSKKQNRWRTKILKEKYPVYELSQIQSEIEQQIQELNFPPQPDTSELIGLLSDYLKWILKDPDSLKDFEVVDLQKCYVPVLPKKQSLGLKAYKLRKKGIYDYTDLAPDPKYDYGGWGVKVRYRAKNSYGGYVIGGGIYAYWNDQVYPTEDEHYLVEDSGERETWDEVPMNVYPLYDDFFDRGYSMLRLVDDPIRFRLVKF